MSSSAHRYQWTEEDAQALLAVFAIQPPPNFTTQVLARVQALHTEPATQSVPPALPLTSQRSSQGFGKAWRSAWRYSWRPRGAVAYGLLAASAVLLWFALMHTLSALAPSDSILTLPLPAVPGIAEQQAVVTTAALLPSLPGPLRGEWQQEPLPPAPLTENVGSLGMPLAASMPMVSLEVLQPQPAERQHGPRSKGKRLSRGMRPS